MHINSIEINNFRGIQHQCFELDSHMNVILGNNTAGKTTLLHAIQISLGAYLQSMSLLPKEKPYRRNFTSSDRVLTYNEAKDDFELSQNNPCVKVNATMLTNGRVSGEDIHEENEISWYREARGNTTIHARRNVGELMDIVHEWETLRTSTDVNTDVVLPITLAFGANRIDNQYKLVIKDKAISSKVSKAYKFSLSENVDFKSALNWIYKYNSKAKNTKEIKGTDTAFFKALEIAAKLKNIAIDRDNRGLWADVQVSGQPVHRLKYEMMSDGFKAMVNIVSEIAYRCIMLNGFLGERAVSETPGIVLIDEVDLYLHPHWQRHVLHDLQEAFPKIQFIVTTHSPFIAQSVETKNIITLDGTLAPVSPSNRGIEEIVACEMGLSNSLRSQTYIKKRELATKYFELVKAGQEGTKEVEEVRKALNKLELEASLLNDPAYESYLQLNRRDI